jgi:uncharacterized membrane protein
VSASEARPRAAAGRPWLPAFLLGVGLGGFVDGIVLHQVLQWHHMLTSTDGHPQNTVAGLEANTLADGLFHVAAWIVTFVGVELAASAWRRGALAPPWRAHAGLLLMGWGAFNLVEGIVDHHVLGLHHVRDDVAAKGRWDLAFLAFGAALVIVGWRLQVRSRASAPPSRTPGMAASRER